MSLHRTRFRLLWHEFVVESPDPTPPLPAGRRSPWPSPPEVTVVYRVEHRRGRCLLHEQGDPWTTCAPEEVSALLSARAAGRATELAEHKGWMPFVGTVLSHGDRRTCLVGPAAARAAAVPARQAQGWVVDSTHGWVSKAGWVLPLPLPPAFVVDGALVAVRVAEVASCPPGPAFAGLLAAAVPRCTAAPTVVREVAALHSTALHSTALHSTAQLTTARPEQAGTVPPGARGA